MALQIFYIQKKIKICLQLRQRNYILLKTSQPVLTMLIKCLIFI